MQLAVVAGLITLAVAYLVRSSWRTLAGSKSGCGSACGKCAAPAPASVPGRVSLPQV